jgi:hypothetical protein
VVSLTIDLPCEPVGMFQPSSGSRRGPFGELAKRVWDRVWVP